MGMLSMTGFGKGEAECDGILVTAEISSVNRKQFDLRVSAPSGFSVFEPLARKLIAETMSRGSIQLKIDTSTSVATAEQVVDAGFLAALVEAACRARREAGLDNAVQVETLMRIPGVVSPMQPDAQSPGAVVAYERALRTALAGHRAMREREGEALKKDLESRERLLESLLAEIEPSAEKINAGIKARLLAKIEEERIPLPGNDAQLMKEVLFYADKSDVTEEITRLHSHFGQFRQFLEGTNPVGRSLDFLVQEMFREITTLGNKAGIPEISPLVVAFKSELEKLREQIQNVE